MNKAHQPYYGQQWDLLLTDTGTLQGTGMTSSHNFVNVLTITDCTL